MSPEHAHDTSSYRALELEHVLDAEREACERCGLKREYLPFVQKCPAGVLNLVGASRGLEGGPATLGEMRAERRRRRAAARAALTCSDD